MRIDLNDVMVIGLTVVCAVSMCGGLALVWLAFFPMKPKQSPKEEVKDADFGC